MTTAVAPRSAGKIPALSVVIASVNGKDLLEPTLLALDALPERDRMEVIVVEAVGGETRRFVREHRPEVVLIEVDDRESIPELRYRGVSIARGDVVAILEDHGVVSQDWAGALLDSHRLPWAAVGGVVENGREGLVNWAAYYCEYSPYMSPMIEGEAANLPGNNIAYKRPYLLRHAEELRNGRWESWINEKLRADGLKTATTNLAVVSHIKPFRFLNFLVQRFHFSRSFAGMRRVDQSPAVRVVYGFGSIALPLVLFRRIAKRVASRSENRKRFVACAPLIAMFLAVGAFGEMLGYFFGPGRSLESVE